MTEECGICSEKATAYCPACLDNFCSKCNTYVHQQTKNSHTFLSLTEKLEFRPSQSIKCSRHKEFVKHFCLDCKVAACGACFLLHHTFHHIIDIDHYSIRKQNELKGMKYFLEVQIKEVDTNKKTLIQNFENIDKEVKDIIENDLKTKEDLIKNSIIEVRGALDKLKNLDQKNIEDVNLTNLISIRKIRFDQSTIQNFFNDIKNIESNTSLETKNPEFMSEFLECYYNRMKDPVYLSTSVEKLLKESPMSLLGLLLKAELLKASKDKEEKSKSLDVYKQIISFSPYDSYDEFVISEAYSALNKREESFNYLKLSALHENMLAKHKLGSIYFNGDIGLSITQNKSEAIKWFRSSCEMGCPLSQYSLGYCYYLGDGVPRDRNEATQFYLASAKQGYTIAEHKLANCLENGIGIEENLEEARSYYEKAASKGYEPALQALALLVEKIYERKLEMQLQNDTEGVRKLSTSVETI